MKTRNLFTAFVGLLNGRKNDMNLNIPRASTPIGVILTLIVLTLILGTLLQWLFGFLGIIILFVILAFTTPIYTQDVAEFHALTLLNTLTGVQRVVFQGRIGKLPWEGPGTLVDLRTEIKDIPEETWATAAGASMKAKYIFMLHPKATEKGILTFAGFTKDTVKAAARNLFSTMLSDYFGKCKDPKELLKKNEINEAVFESENGKEKIQEFEHKYGVDSSAKLEDVDYDEATQKARDLITNAESFDEAMEILMRKMSKKEALRIAKLSSFPNVKDFNLNVTGLENLHTANFAGGLGFPGDEQKGGGKK